MFRPTRRPSSGLQCFKRLNIVCVWLMLRSHHLAYLRQMRHSPSTLTEGFPCYFLSSKTNARVQLAKTGRSPQSSQLGDNFYAVISSLILVWPLWTRIPESLPTKVVNCVGICTVLRNCVLYYRHRVST